MSRVLFKLLCKLIQRQTYSCLSTRYGIILCIGGLLLTLISLLQFSEVLLEWSMQKYSLKFNIYHDNVGGTSYQDRLCLPIPIDVVYTWVNGSDPKLLRQLQKLKEDIDSGSNNTKDGVFDIKTANLTSKRTFKRFRTSSRSPGARVDLDVSCSYADCVSARISVVVNSFKGRSLILKHVQDLHHSFKSIFKILNKTSKGEKKDNLVLLYFPNSESTHNALVDKVKVDHKSVDMFQGYFTSDGKIQDSLESKDEIIITGFKKYTDLAELHKNLQKKFGRKLSDISYDPKKHIAIVYFTDQASTKSALDELEGNYTIDGGATLKVSRAFLTWTYSWSFRKNDNQLNDIYSEDDHVISASRFADNQELKYSLRSIQRFSPWIRNIYIVTNGQIPSWLNLDNPRVKIVTHKAIFANHSHLPTFSSPAIESHIHRIPGLSKKFIYMNDDVMFGDHVWPDDFYTHSKGQKIFLTWGVPNCNEGCPASWIQDKYCDKACNVSSCDYDGGDCIGVKQNTRYAYQSWHNQQSRFRLDFCNTGCADTWVGDRYCDTACNVYNCGFDAGDCGIAQFGKLHGVDVTHNNEAYHLPDGLKVVYFNLSKIFNSAKLTEAEHSENMIIRTAIISQKFKLLSLTLRNNYTLTTVAFRITGNINETKTVKFNFNVTVQTTGTFQMTTSQPISLSPTTESMIPTLPVVKKAKDFKSIEIIYSNQSINYWMVVNLSLPKPTWTVLGHGIYNAPVLSNNTSLPENVKSELKNLDQELKEGDITDKGYRRRKANLLKEFLKDDDHDDAVIANQDSKVDETDPQNNQQQKQQGKSSYPSQKNQRHLLSIVYDEQDELNSLYNPIDITRNVEPVPSDDEVFLENWIANSKRKQLSYEDDLKKSSHDWHERYGNWNPRRDNTETSFLPWERQKFFKRTHIQEEHREILDKYSTQGRTGRRLLDTFADSLLHVHNLYNRKFGYAGRKVPAHMPHMIDIDIMKELQDTFPEEFDQTSSHKLRSSDDMQFAFSYNYFVIGQTRTLNVTKLFAELDTDNSGTLSDRELRTLATKIYPLPLNSADIKNLEKALMNCSITLDMKSTAATSQQSKNNADSALPIITESLLSLCTQVTKLLNDSKGTAKKYKHETAGDEDIAFKMLSNNASMVLRQLDNIRAHKKKFICLNDNIDHSQNATLVRALLVDFYKSFFPNPSQFELAENYRNTFLYVEDLDKWKEEQKELKKKNQVIIMIVVFILMGGMFWRKMVRFLKWMSPLRRRFIPSVSDNSNTRLLSI